MVRFHDGPGGGGGGVGHRRIIRSAAPYWLAPGVAGLAFLTYASTMRAGVGFGDSGELVAAAIELGVPHPPGYPFWTGLAHLWTLLPGGPAWNVALSSALYTALAVGGVAWLTWRAIDLNADAEPTLARAAVAAAAAFLFAFSTEAWSSGIATEVYALHMLMAVVVWACLLQWGRRAKASRWLLLAGLALGLGLSNHQTLLLAAPGYAAFALAWCRRDALRPRGLALTALGVVLGLSAYLLLPVWSARDPIVDWSNTETWEGFRPT